ncbi:MAG TPA: hypothetical protein DF383_04195 [Deltaproteobacteria bacterium]|nr:hypothetical protein [Deltaproteobacteria bacterium]
MKLFHVAEGEGPTLLLNHGWTTTHRFFQRQKSLSSRFRLVFWDLPGHGRSEQRPEGYTLADCAAALRDLIQQLGLEAAAVLGWSMGGQVIWEYIRRFGPEPFTKIVNVESIPWAETKRFHVSSVEKSFHRDRPRAQRKMIRNMFHGQVEASVVEEMLQEALQTPTETALKYYREIAHADYREVFASLKIPVLTLLGRHGFHSDQALDLTDLNPRNPLRWLEHSGHMPFWEEAELFNGIVSDFLL